jgi:16S rRNA (uracil1498-N3)-methyltransferase
MTRIASTAPRLFVPDPLSEGSETLLSPAQAHYLRDVMRMNVGDAVRLFNGRDGMWLASIAALGKSKGALGVESLIAPQRPEPEIWLLFAPLKAQRQDMLVEKAVELGVSVLQPVLTQRTQTRRINAERLEAQVIEAAEQCERLTLPEVRPLAELSGVLGAWEPSRRLFYGDETGNGAAALAAFSAPRGVGGDALLVGPEGGFSPQELDVLAAASFSSGVGLGPRILRAETAALAALALWQAVRGDGARLPGH